MGGINDREIQEEPRASDLRVDVIIQLLQLPEHFLFEVGIGHPPGLVSYLDLAGLGIAKERFQRSYAQGRRPGSVYIVCGQGCEYLAALAGSANQYIQASLATVAVQGTK